jgi:nitrate reductase gamma subunit
MNAAYLFVTGPLAWAAFLVFGLGLIGKLGYSLYMARSRDPEVLRYFSLKYALRSILNWLSPFRARSWRMQPDLTGITFIFHICLILVPVFLSAHIVLLEQKWGFSYWTLPDSVADVLTVVVILSCLYFAGRRVLSPQQRFTSGLQDWLILGLVLLPFLTGFIAYHQLGGYQVVLILHIVCGEILLAAIPFTRLSHMFLGPLLRAHIGSEFGLIRRARDW